MKHFRRNIPPADVEMLIQGMRVRWYFDFIDQIYSWVGKNAPTLTQDNGFRIKDYLVGNTEASIILRYSCIRSIGIAAGNMNMRSKGLCITREM